MKKELFWIAMIWAAGFALGLFMATSACASESDYSVADVAWYHDSVVVMPHDSLGAVVDCVIVNADRETISRRVVDFGNYPRLVVFADYESVNFGALAYCRRGK